MKTGFARSLMHVERADDRVRVRTWTFSTTSTCLKRHGPPKKSVKREEISAGEFFPSYCTFPVQPGSDHCPANGGWRMCALRNFGLLTCGPLLNFHARLFFPFLSFKIIFCSEDSRNLWFLQRVAGRPLTCSPTR